MSVSRCLIVGGGPAGMMLGFLLARPGIDVAVLEKHADFFRDFRADTMHPSTLDIMHELGVPIGGLLMRISNHGKDPGPALGLFTNVKLLVLLHRDDYWQCPYVIPKRAFETIKARPLSEFHDQLVSIAGFLRGHIGQLD